MKVWCCSLTATVTHTTAGIKTGSAMSAVTTVEIATVVSRRSPETTANAVLFLERKWHDNTHIFFPLNF